MQRGLGRERRVWVNCSQIRYRPNCFGRLCLKSAIGIACAVCRCAPPLSASLAIRDLAVIAYAGVPLITSTGHTLGALCVIDHQPRNWTAEQLETLGAVAAGVVAAIEQTP